MGQKRTVTPKKPEASRMSDVAIEASPAQRTLAIEASPAQRSDRDPSPHQPSSSDSSKSSGSYHSPSPVPCDREIRRRESDNEYDPAEEVFS
jgi:hypothetical protein